MVVIFFASLWIPLTYLVLNICFNSKLFYLNLKEMEQYITLTFIIPLMSYFFNPATGQSEVFLQLKDPIFLDKNGNIGHLVFCKSIPLFQIYASSHRWQIQPLKCVALAPNQTNPRIFQIRFAEPKCTESDLKKSPDLSHLWSIRTNLTSLPINIINSPLWGFLNAESDLPWSSPNRGCQSWAESGSYYPQMGKIWANRWKMFLNVI